MATDVKSIPWDDEKPSGNAIAGVPWDDEQSQTQMQSKTSNVEPISKIGRIAKGVKDPIDALAQIAYHGLPASFVKSMDEINNYLSDKTGLVSRIPEGGLDQMISDAEKEYQQRRASSGSEGIDLARMGGNVAAMMLLANKLPTQAKSALWKRMLQGGVAGAGYGLLNPVTDTTDSSFVEEKAKQGGVGFLGGAAAPALMAGVARVVSPLTSLKNDVQKLISENVKPTVGQVLGGRWNIAEEKLQDMPFIGGAISNARNRSLASYNKAAINRAVAPIGDSVEEIGEEGIRKAGDKLSAFYENTLKKISGVKFDAKFDADLIMLRRMASNLTPDMSKKFNKTLNDILESRMSPNRSMLPEVWKKVSSEIGENASDFASSSTASERELGKAFAQLGNLLKEQMLRSNPQVAQAISQADKGWANLVRLELAGKSATNTGGVFTPAQLNAAIKAADDSVRKRAVTRGTALMSDLGKAGNILGNKFPNSGTTGRLLANTVAGTSLPLLHLIDPSMAALAAGGTALGMLSARPTIQNALVKLIAERPQAANAIAQKIRERSLMAVPVTAALTEQAISP